MADTTSPRYVLVPVELLASRRSFAEMEEAMGAALLAVRNDSKPRAVVQVMAEFAPDPLPAVVVTRFDAAAEPQAVANG